MKKSFLLLLALTALVWANLACTQTPDTPESAEADVMIYLLRHAETMPPPYEDSPPNPPLSETGQARAEALVAVLASANVTRIFSTDYRRTQETVQPLSAALGLAVESYNPRDLAAFADSLRGMSGTIVVSGHSNTTPALATALGGHAGDPIDEATEFNRLYILDITAAQASAGTIVTSYGPSPTEE